MQDNSFYSKYKYIRTLGHGGCGDVFLAQNVVLGNLWAVKEIVKGRKTSVSGYIEPEILKRLNHPALPRICDLYEDENKIYIVEDYLEGTCLKQELDQKGRFEEQIVIDWAIQLCSVLEYLHSQKPNAIIYGDMKPHNIILTKEGFVKLIDFGISTMVSETNDKPIVTYNKSISNNCIRDSTGNSTNEVCFVSDNRMAYEEAINDALKDSNNKTLFETAFIGTKGYAAPEQFVGNGISRASDIYSLGITIIQLLTGLDPLVSNAVFQNENYEQHLSPGLCEIIKKCIHPNPRLRYKSTSLLMKELRNYSLQYCIYGEKNVLDLSEPLGFTKIIAITGARGTGISTITAAIAENMARGRISVCIVDLSTSGCLGKSMFGRNEIIRNIVTEEGIKNVVTVNNSINSNNLLKINSNLYYTNLNNLTGKINTDILTLHKQLGCLQDRFSYILLDVDITQLGCLEKYLTHIFIVTDMNPFNLSSISQVMETEELAIKCSSRTSFVINKFYMGELGSRDILQGMLLSEDSSKGIQELVVYSKVFEIPYEQNIYLKWMYSFFGETLSFKKHISNKFQESILHIISNTISPAKKKARFTFRKLISKVVL